jgi:hypothetical protein
MYVIIAQFNTQGGPYSGKNYKIVFDIDETQKEGALNLAAACDKGTELLLLAFKTQKEESNSLLNESQEETRKRFFRQMYAMIHEAAKRKNKKPEEIKTLLKEFLIRRKFIVSSSKELNIDGLAAAIYFIQTEFLNDDYDNNEEEKII